MKNLFRLPEDLAAGSEIVEVLSGGYGTRVERIISTGRSTPAGEWYDQPWDEWVALLEGRATLSYEDGRTVTLERGDWLLIPAHVKHRVEATSADPPCVWLAVHWQPDRRRRE